VFQSPEQTLEALAQVGYLTDPITATTVYLADRLHKPLLLEGPAGSGKTELSYAVMRAVDAPIERLSCFEGITPEHAIGKFDEAHCAQQYRPWYDARCVLCRRFGGSCCLLGTSW
jgi:MoxR-like ATPase